MVAVGFLSRYLSGPLPYVSRYITVNKMCRDLIINNRILFSPHIVIICMTDFNIYFGLFFSSIRQCGKCSLEGKLVNFVHIVLFFNPINQIG